MCIRDRSKHFTTGGEGGMVVTNNEDLAWECRSFRDHGYDVRQRMNLLAMEEKLPYVHNRVGFNYRMTEPQSVLGINELERFDSWNLARRLKYAKMYDEAFAGLPGIAKLPVNTAERKMCIRDSIQTTYKIRDCIKTDFNNNIPLVVTNAEISGDPDSVLKKRLTLYAPHGASVKVEKNSAELVKQASGYDVFTYDIEISGTGRYIYEVEVSVAGKTEVYKKVILQQVEKGALLVDLTNQNTIDAIAKISTNKYGTGLNIGNSALQAEFSGKLSRITIKPDSFTLGNNFDGYTAIRFEVKNTGPNKAIGLSLSVAAGSSDVVCGSSGSILPGETKVVIANFPKDYLDSNSLQNIQSLKISQTERASENEYYEISNIMVVSVDNNVN